MGLFGGDTTSTQITAPWQGAQPYLKQVMGSAQGLYQGGQGYKAPNFQTWVPFSSQTQGALSGIWNQASQGNPLAGQSMGALSGILSGDTAQKYNDLYANSGNQAWGQAVQNQSDLLANDIQRQFGSMGRIGSAADTGALATQLGNFRTQALADQWNQNIANQRGILGDMTSGQLSAASAAPGAYQSQFLPYQYQAQVGQAYDNQAAQKLQARIRQVQHQPASAVEPAAGLLRHGRRSGDRQLLAAIGATAVQSVRRGAWRRAPRRLGRQQPRDRRRPRGDRWWPPGPSLGDMIHGRLVSCILQSRLVDALEEPLRCT